VALVVMDWNKLMASAPAAVRVRYTSPAAQAGRSFRDKYLDAIPVLSKHINQLEIPGVFHNELVATGKNGKPQLASMMARVSPGSTTRTNPRISGQSATRANVSVINWRSSGSKAAASPRFRMICMVISCEKRKHPGRVKSRVLWVVVKMTNKWAK
jgi:hypothetical protein